MTTVFQNKEVMEKERIIEIEKIKLLDEIETQKRHNVKKLE